MRRSLFVTATDTGAGKTWVTSSLVKQCLQQGLDIQALKPIASGVEATHGLNEDVALLLQTQSDKDISDINLHTFRTPVTPALAALQEGESLELAKLLSWVESQSQHAETTIVEGVGGLMVPMQVTGNVSWLVSDWVKTMTNTDIMLVAPLKLGCMNQILLSCQLLSHIQCMPKWIVLNDMHGLHTADETLQMIRPFLKQMFGEVPQIIMLGQGQDMPNVFKEGC